MNLNDPASYPDPNTIRWIILTAAVVVLALGIWNRKHWWSLFMMLTGAVTTLVFAALLVQNGALS